MAPQRVENCYAMRLSYTGKDAIGNMRGSRCASTTTLCKSIFYHPFNRPSTTKKQPADAANDEHKITTCKSFRARITDSSYFYACNPCRLKCSKFVIFYSIATVFKRKGIDYEISLFLQVCQGNSKKILESLVHS